MTGGVYADKSINDNGGFSLVELIICIAILGIATIPLLSAFSTSGRVIGKAQSMQNATSVAEAVMEEVKGSTIQQLKEKDGYAFLTDGGISYSAFMADSYDKISYGEGKIGSNKAVLVQKGDEPFFVFFKANVKSDADEVSTDGEQFDVVATIDATESYTGAEDDSAIDANSIKLPVIDRIDKGKHAVISKEINRLDPSAAESWKDNWRDKNHKDSSDPTTLSKLKKEVVITIDDPVSDTDPEKHLVDVECYVRYYSADCPKYEDDEFAVSEKVYSGTFLGTKDSRVYIFYRTARQSIHTNNAVNSLSGDEDVIDHEDIIIKSTSTDTIDPDDPRLAYLMFQEDEEHPTSDSNYYQMGSGGTKYTITAETGGQTKVTANSDAKFGDDGQILSPDKTLMIVTNLPKTGDDRQAFFYTDKDDYIYAIDVFVYDKNKNEKVHLSSTKDAQLSTTPIPSVTITTTPVPPGP